MKPTPAPLERYYARSEITVRQYKAGRRYRADYEGGGAVVVTVTAAYRPREYDPGKAEMLPTERVVNSATSYDDAARSLNRHLKPVVDAVCLKGLDAGQWGKLMNRTSTEAMALLRVGLESLADHYRQP